MAKEVKAQQIKITLVRSLIGSLPAQRKTAKALGLGKIGSSVVQDSNSVIQGMVRVVSHLVKVEEI